MRLVIIESPYRATATHSVNDHLQYARECLLHSLDRGEAPFASHLIYTQVLDDTNLRERARGIQAGYEWMQRATVVAFYVDLGWSEGMIRALRVARIWQRPIEIRAIYTPTTSIESPPEVVSLLLEAGLVEQIPAPFRGVTMYRFTKDEDHD